MKNLKRMLIPLVLVFACSGCGEAAKADYESPKAVIEAHNAIHTEWENNQLYDDLEGKTFKVKATEGLDNSNAAVETGADKKSDKSEKGKLDDHRWVCIPYSDIGTDVMLWMTDEQYAEMKYKKGDTLVLEVSFIAQRGTKEGKLRQYYINAILPEE